jgi:hypothetical protein
MVAPKVVAESGVKVTEIVQLDNAARVAPHVVVCAKSAGLAPVRDTPMLVSVALPGFESVMICAAVVVFTVVDAKVSVAGVSEACAAVPVPVRLAVWVAALLATDRVPVNVAADVGVNVTRMVQLPGAERVVPQVLVSAKSWGLAPAMLMAMPVRGAVPVFARLMDIEPLVTLTCVLGKVTEVGVRTACPTGADVPVPLSATCCGEPVALSATLKKAEKLVGVVGVKVTARLQVALPASVAPHGLVAAVDWAKAVGLDPVRVNPEKLVVAVLVLVTSKVVAGLVVLTVWLLNTTEPGTMDSVACVLMV